MDNLFELRPLNFHLFIFCWQQVLFVTFEEEDYNTI